MQVTSNLNQFVKQFQPFTLHLNVDTLEEAVALRALWGGGQGTTYLALAEQATVMPSTGPAVERVCVSIGAECHAQLVAQGII